MLRPLIEAGLEGPLPGARHDGPGLLFHKKCKFCLWVCICVHHTYHHCLF